MRVLALIIFLISNSSEAFFCTTKPAKIKRMVSYIERNFSYTTQPDIKIKPRKLRNFIQDIQNCDDMISDLGLESCLQNDLLPFLKTTLKRKTRRGSHDLNFEVSDKEYFRNTPTKALKLPKEFKNGLPENYREIAKKNGWDVLEYRSRTVVNPGGAGSRNRILFQINDPPFERWIQFTSPESEDQVVKENLIDYISIDTDKDPQKIYFTQYWRDDKGQNPKRRDKAGHHFDSCYSCHPNGMRQLSPVPGSVDQKDLKTFDKMREKIDGYQKLDWGISISPEGYGPALGKEEGCVRCHNNHTGAEEVSRGAINYFTTESHIQHKYHGDFSMTPTNRKSEKKFLEDMLHISKQISEEDRKEILKEIKKRGAEYDNRSYSAILDYIEENKIDVDFNTDEYRETLRKLVERNQSKTVYALKSNLADDFKESLFARCNLYSPPTYGAEVNENRENTPPQNETSSPQETQQGVNVE